MSQATRYSVQKFGVIVAKSLPAVFPSDRTRDSRHIVSVEASEECAEAQVPPGCIVRCLFALIEGVSQHEMNMLGVGLSEFVTHKVPAPQQHEQSRPVCLQDLPRLR